MLPKVKQDGRQDGTARWRPRKAVWRGVRCSVRRGVRCGVRRGVRASVVHVAAARVCVCIVSAGLQGATHDTAALLWLQGGHLQGRLAAGELGPPLLQDREADLETLLQ